MTYYELLITLTIVISSSVQYKLESDKSTEGIILFPHGKCNVQEGSKSISYALDLTVLQELNEKIADIERNCVSDHNYFRKFHHRMKEINEFKGRFRTNSISNTLTLDSFLFLNSLLEISNIFNNKSISEQCSMVYNSTIQLTKLYMEIDKLSNNDFSTLSVILSRNKLKKDIANLIDGLDRDEYFFPFTFSNNFIEEMFTSSNFLLQFDDSMMYLTFIIPMYRSYNVSIFIPKPIYKNYTWYSFKTNARFIVSNGTQTFLFDDHEWNNLCFTFDRMIFCSPNSIRDICDREFFLSRNRSNVDMNCFNKHLSNDIGIQINSTIYFMTKSSTKIYLNCKNSYFPIFLDHPLVIELEGCSIKTPFFQYDEHFGNISYKVYISSYQEYRTFERGPDFSTFEITIFLLIFALLTLCPCLVAFYHDYKLIFWMK